MDDSATLYGKLLHKVRQLMALADLNNSFSDAEARRDFLRDSLHSILEQAYSELNVLKGSLKISGRVLRDITGLQASLPKPSSVEVDVRIETDLGLVGVIDLVIDGIPFELKASRPSKEDEVQLTWYALLLERVLGKSVDMGYIEYLTKRTRKVIHISRNLRLKALKCWEKALELIYVPPPLVRSSRCKGCIYESLCSSLLL